METVEKIWAGDAKMQYPKQWIVFVEIEYDKATHKDMGIVHSTTPDRKEAYARAKALEKIRGSTMVIEGFDDTRRLGGWWMWEQ